MHTLLTGQPGALTPSQLALRCDPASLAVAAPASPDGAGAGDSVPPAAIVGQTRALDAVRFGIAMTRPGYHLFVTGSAGSGKRSLVRHAIKAHLADDGVVRSDWVYVHNFDKPHRPVALQLPAGGGARLRAELQELVDELRATIPAAFESEEYVSSLERLNTELKQRAEQGLGVVSTEARRRGLVMVRTPAGFSFAPRKGDDVMSTEDFEALPTDQREQLQQALSDLQDQLLHTLRASMRLSKEHADRLRALNRATTQLAVDHAVADTRQRYAGEPAVLIHLEAVRSAVIDNADAFRTREDGDNTDPAAALARFEVNVVLDASGSDGSALIEADQPTYQNLIGRIDHVAHFGTLVTDFRHIQAGQLHRANGGYLMVDAVKLLTQPFAWEALKRALLRRQIHIESMAEAFSLVSTVQLEPQPIPLDVKVVLVGERAICALLQAHDPEFGKLFRVVADLDDDLPREPANQRALAMALACHAREAGLLPPSPVALACLIDHSARRSGDATRLDSGVRRLIDLMHEADFLARRPPQQGDAGEPPGQIGASQVTAAIAARRLRAGRTDERLRAAMMRDIVTIATAGAQVGQVNGLAVYGVGDELFGMPTRITATARLGDGRVVDIQRETRMGGPVHAKGVLILSSFLASRYARLRPLSIVGTLVFEQTYGMIEGDSASLAELVALLTSIAGVPVRQGLAVTGSVDQFGQVQAVGGVNEKIEAFFDLCVARGLDGTQGALLPASNVSQLMLRDDLVAAVAAGRFSVHAVSGVDQALALLTGLPAGDPAVPDDTTVNGRITRRLREFSRHSRAEPGPRAAREPGRTRTRR